MTTNQLIFVLLAAALLFAALAAFGIAFRQSSRQEEWRKNLDKDAKKSDAGVPAGVLAASAASRVEAEPEAAADTEVLEPATDDAPPAPVVARTVETQRVTEIDAEDAGVLRRQFLNRAMAGTFFSALGVMGLASFSFAWPRVKGGFGADIDAGDVDEIRSAIFNADGSITPLFWPEAKTWIVPVDAGQESGSQFSDNFTVAGGLAALWQKCVHLGCRVPWCQTSQGFECPCHGSKYNSLGEYEAGPAPRNLDRFVVEINESNRFIVKTSQVIPTERAQAKNAPYPLGPSCITISAGEGEA